MGGEYTYMGTQTLKTINEVAKSTNRTFDEVMEDIVKQHFDRISIPEETKEVAAPAAAQTSRPKQDGNNKDLGL